MALDIASVDQDTKADVHCTLAVARYSQSHHDDAIALVRDGLLLLSGNSRLDTRIDIATQQSGLYRYLEDFDKAHLVLRETLALAEQHGLTQEQARIHQNIARLHMQGNKMGAALEHAQLAVDLANTSGNHVIAPYALELLGSALSAQGKQAEAHQYLKLAERLGADADDDRVVCQVLDVQSRMFLQQGDLDEALATCRRGGDVASAIGDPQVLCRFKLMESEILEQQGDAASALRAHKAYVGLAFQDDRQQARVRLQTMASALDAVTEREAAARKKQREIATQRDYLETTLEAIAQRSGELTRQLLAFSRKQALRPQTIDVNAKIFEMRALMQRALGESLEVRLVPGEDLWNCRADPGQVENALLNLTVNARDAMVDGGLLTVESSNVTLDEDYAWVNVELAVGDYVCLSISDNGTGMAPEVVSHAFEPFYPFRNRLQPTLLPATSGPF
jgi:signal transduction histidine kinase